MAGYFANRTVRMTSAEEKKFRQMLDAWCDMESGYDGKRFGHDVEIIEVQDSPIYRAHLRVQYDDRTLDWQREPTTLQKTASVTAFSQVDTKAMAAEPTDFRTDTILRRIPGSEQTLTCETCRGHGTVRCPECNGSGKTTVQRERKVTCSSCGGSGKYSWTTTESYWMVPGRPATKGNEGPGKQFYTKTVTHTANCAQCGGSGKLTEKYSEQVTCSKCRGSGIVSCSTCGGTGKMLCSIVLRQELYQKERGRYLLPSMLTDNEQNELMRFLSDTSWSRTEGFRIKGNKFSECEAGSRPVIGAMARKLGKIMEGYPGTACFGQLDIYVCPARVIKYSYQGKEYRCCIYGDDNRLFAVSSPISDYLDNIRNDLRDTLEKHNFGDALEKIRKIQEFSQATEEDKAAAEKIRDRMRLTSFWGKIFGSFAAMLAMFPLMLCLFSTYNIVAPWTEIIYDYFYPPTFDAAFRIIAGFSIAFVFVKNDWVLKIPAWTSRNKSAAARALLGFLWGLSATLIYMIPILALNYLGILWVITAAILLLFLVAIGAIGSAVTLIIMLLYAIF